MQVEKLPAVAELAVIGDRTEQMAHLSKLSAGLSARFASNPRGAWNDVFYQYEGCDEVVYGIEIWLRGAWVGCSLNGPALNDPVSFRSILQFATFSEKSGSDLVAARLAKSKDHVYLLHDGRVHSDGRGSPSAKHVFELDGRSFYLVSDMSPQYFTDNLIEFHLSRLNPALGVAKAGQPEGAGYDPGSSRGGHRSAADFSAQHHPITKRLRGIVEEYGFQPISCPVFSPDLLIKRDDFQVLFEIKPKSNLHDLIVGCGQLLLYNQCANADKLVLVTEPLKESASTNEIRKHMSQHKIKLMTYREAEVGFAFDDLPACLARD